MKPMAMAMTAMVALAAGASARAETAFALDPLFSDGVTFAEGKPMRVFGRGDGEVTVRIAGRTASARAADGRWCVEFPRPPAADCTYEMTVTHGDEVKTVRDVRVGEVWLIAGQSNMQFKLKDESGYPGNAVDDPGVAWHVSDRPEAGERFAASNGWQKAAGGVTGDWSAIGWLFARARRRIAGKRVGVVGCYQGASTIQAWLPAEVADAPRFRLAPEELHGDHKAPKYFWNKAEFLYRRTFLPLAPFSFTGVVWYQGESNTGPGEGRIYADLLAEMIATWRRDLRDADLPFLIVGIADFSWRDDPAWRAIQRAQEGMPLRCRRVVTVPCNARPQERDQIHPPTKGELAERLAAAAGKSAEFFGQKR